MKSTKFFVLSIVVLVMVLVSSMQADAALQNLGTDSLGNRLIYDTDLDITWYDYTHSATRWQNQVDWASALDIDFGGTHYTDWRLPVTNTCYGYYCGVSEMGHLYYTELHNSAGGPLTNTGDFQDLQSANYWSGSTYTGNSNTAWLINFSSGHQSMGNKGSINLNAIAVMDGRVIAKTIITNCAELQNMRDDLAEDYILENDIDCSDTVNWDSGAGFEPIGRDTDLVTSGFQGTPFSGSFDGDGYTISDLYINRPNEFYIGLFGNTSSNAQITNVNLDNVAITGRSYNGAISGWNEGTISSVIVNINPAGSISAMSVLGGAVGRNHGTIDDVHVTGAVTTTIENGYVTGGVVGTNWAGTITDSSFNGNVLGGRHVGGFVGNNHGGGIIERSFSTGTVDTNHLGPQRGMGRAGGFVGENTVGSIIRNYYYTADVTNKRDTTGGFCGLNYDGSSIINSYSAGDVYSLNGSGYGGFVGESYSSTCTATFWDSDTQTHGVTTSACGAIGLPTADMQTQSTFTNAGWDFNTIWKMVDYPHLQSEILDPDGDGIIADNCPLIFNPDQADNDADSIGDVCDPDDDNDGVLDTSDNCPMVSNPDQTDNDLDNAGEVCDDDDDNDSVLDVYDNCPFTANMDQSDIDGDTLGDVCDDDPDGDAVLAGDNCPLNPNPLQEDNDSDGSGDACDDDDDNDGVPDTADNCPTIANQNQADLDTDNIGDACDIDIDGDGVENDVDNCPLIANIGQENTDNDGEGDGCDADDDNDGILDVNDNCSLIVNSDQSDFDGDGQGDVCDGDLDGDGVGNDVDNCISVANANQYDWNNDGEGDACDDDVDGDGVVNGSDQCEFTPLGDVVDPANGCSIDQLNPCAHPQGQSTPWKNHGQYVSSVTHTANSFVQQGLITQAERNIIVSNAANSTCGHK